MRYITHVDAVWRDRADFLIRAAISSDGEPLSEQLWARQVGDFEFELCCIPFYLYGYSLGDIVGTNQEYDLTHLVTRGPRFDFRVLFPRETNSELHLEEIASRGYLVERCSDRLFAIDAESEEWANELSRILTGLEDAGILQFETAR